MAITHRHTYNYHNYPHCHTSNVYTKVTNGYTSCRASCLRLDRHHASRASQSRAISARRHTQTAIAHMFHAALFLFLVARVTISRETRRT